MKVLFQSRKTLYSAPGGDTTQLLKTKEYLEKLGVEEDITLDLEPDVSGYDLVHVFNLMRPQELYLQVKNAKKQGKKVALSTIYGPYEEYEKKARGGLLQVLNNFLSITQIEYLKVIARAVLNFEMSKGTLVYLLHGHKRLQRKIVKMVEHADHLHGIHVDQKHMGVIAVIGHRPSSVAVESQKKINVRESDLFAGKTYPDKQNSAVFGKKLFALLKPALIVLLKNHLYPPPYSPQRERK